MRFFRCNYENLQNHGTLEVNRKKCKKIFKISFFKPKKYFQNRIDYDIFERDLSDEISKI